MFILSNIVPSLQTPIIKLTCSYGLRCFMMHHSLLYICSLVSQTNKKHDVTTWWQKRGITHEQLLPASHGTCWRNIFHSHLSDPAPAMSSDCGPADVFPSVRHQIHVLGNVFPPETPAYEGHTKSGSPGSSIMNIEISVRSSFCTWYTSHQTKKHSLKYLPPRIFSNFVCNLSDFPTHKTSERTQEENKKIFVLILSKLDDTVWSLSKL